MKKSKKLIIFILIPLLIIFACFLAILKKSDTFQMSADNDGGFYVSQNKYLTYCDNALSVYDRAENKTKVYTENENTERNSYYVEYKNFQFYTADNGLAVMQNGENEEIISGSTQNFVISGDYVVYQTSDSVLLKYDLKSKTPQKIKTDDGYKIKWFDAGNNKIFLSSCRYDEAQGNTLQIKVYDLKTSEDAQSVSCKISDNAKILRSGEDIFVVSPPKGEIGIYKVDFSNQKLEKLYTHINVDNIAANSGYIIFSSEQRSANELITRTVENENNGLWKFDLKSEKAVKISEQCVFDDLVATDNYVYGLTKKYVLPRGTANSWTAGFEIEQIPVSGE